VGGETVSAVLPVNQDGIVPLAELAAIRRRRQGWDVLVYLTDLPRRSGTQPVMADFSMTHAVALISLPAVGWVRLRRCVRDVVVYLLRRLAEQRRQLRHENQGRPAEVARRHLLRLDLGHSRGAPSVAPHPHHGRVGHGHGPLAVDLQPPVGPARRSSHPG
jgi:hypothetical protein